jgi:glycosyltransferase involved in cell wall biosynthesis|tara:strand:+ start:8766 stop:9986 length:1221 start_codon:yes stop_codon:yes gene_type:complete
MNIIHCPRRFTRSSWGGTETCLLSLAKMQQGAGHDVQVMSTKALDCGATEVVEAIAVRRFDYIYPWFGLTQDVKQALDHSGGNLFSIGLLRGLLAEKEVDVLHAHSGKRLGGIVRTAAKIKKIPYVVSLHGGLFDIPEVISEARDERQQGKFEWGKILGAAVGARRVYEDAAAIFCLSDSEKKAAEKQFPNARIEYLPNGVDVNRFKNANKKNFRQQWGISESAKVILNLSRIDPQKNQLKLVDTLPHLLKTVPEAHLLIIGHITDPVYHQRLLRRVEDLGLQAKVTIIAGIDYFDPQLVAAYKASDVFCLPSVHEPFGIVVLEAWAAGLPVVANAVGGIGDFTQDGIDILHSGDDTPKSWAKKITMALEPNIAGHIRTSASLRVAREYDWSVIGRRVTNIYEEVK